MVSAHEGCGEHEENAASRQRLVTQNVWDASLQPDAGNEVRRAETASIRERVNELVCRNQRQQQQQETRQTPGLESKESAQGRRCAKEKHRCSKKEWNRAEHRHGDEPALVGRAEWSPARRHRVKSPAFRNWTDDETHTTL